MSKEEKVKKVDVPPDVPFSIYPGNDVMVMCTVCRTPHSVIRNGKMFNVMTVSAVGNPIGGMFDVSINDVVRTPGRDGPSLAKIRERIATWLDNDVVVSRDDLFNLLQDVRKMVSIGK